MGLSAKVASAQSKTKFAYKKWGALWTSQANNTYLHSFIVNYEFIIHKKIIIRIEKYQDGTPV